MADNTVALLVIGDGRFDYLQQAVDSARHNLRYPFIDKIMVNDAGIAAYSEKLKSTFQDWNIISHDKRMGLSESIRSGWDQAMRSGAEYVFHLEEDFVFNTEVHINRLVSLLEDNDLDEIILKRDHVNPAEVEAGGFMRQRPDYEQKKNYVSQNWLFFLNPCLYKLSKVMSVGWPSGGGEREFTDSYLEKYPDAEFGIVGHMDDPPIVSHIGSHRSEGWKV